MNKGLSIQRNKLKKELEEVKKKLKETEEKLARVSQSHEYYKGLCFGKAYSCGVLKGRSGKRLSMLEFAEAYLGKEDINFDMSQIERVVSAYKPRLLGDSQGLNGVKAKDVSCIIDETPIGAPFHNDEQIMGRMHRQGQEISVLPASVKQQMYHDVLKEADKHIADMCKDVEHSSKIHEKYNADKNRGALLGLSNAYKDRECFGEGSYVIDKDGFIESCGKRLKAIDELQSSGRNISDGVPDPKGLRDYFEYDTGMEVTTWDDVKSQNKKEK